MRNWVVANARWGVRAGLGAAVLAALLWQYAGGRSRGESASSREAAARVRPAASGNAEALSAILLGADKRDAAIGTIDTEASVTLYFNIDAPYMEALGEQRATVQRRIREIQPESCVSRLAWEGKRFLDVTRARYVGGEVGTEGIMCDGERAYAFGSGAKSPPYALIYELSDIRAGSPAANNFRRGSCSAGGWLGLSHLYLGRFAKNYPSLRQELDPYGAKVVGRESMNGVESVRMEGSLRMGDEEFKAQWWVIPSRSYSLAQRVMTRTAPGDTGSNWRESRLVWEWGGWKQFADGLWFCTTATETANVRFRDGQEFVDHRMTFHVQSLKVNSPIPKGTFAEENVLPRGAQVFERSAEDRERPKE